MDSIKHDFDVVNQQLSENTFWHERAKHNYAKRWPALINRKDSYYYLCTPYAKFMHEDVEAGTFTQEQALEEAFQMASEMLMFLQVNGIFVYSPIVHNHVPSKYSDKALLDYNFWLKIDFKHIYISRGLIVCKMAGWDKSYGIGKEIEYAKELELPIHYTDFMEMPKDIKV